MLVRCSGPVDRFPDRAGARLSSPNAFVVGFITSSTVTMISWGFGAGDDPRVGLVLLTLTASALGAVSTVPGAIGAGALCWACYSGFVLNRMGVLTLDGGGEQALLTIVLAATATSGGASLMRWIRAVVNDRGRSPVAGHAAECR